jgi:hypothetical protein
VRPRHGTPNLCPINTGIYSFQLRSLAGRTPRCTTAALALLQRARYYSVLSVDVSLLGAALFWVQNVWLYGVVACSTKAESGARHCGSERALECREVFAATPQSHHSSAVSHQGSDQGAFTL